MFAKRTGWPCHLNRLTKKLRGMQEAGCVLLDLTESNPTRCQFHYPAEILSGLNDPKTLTYAPSPKGMSKAREAVAGYYSEKGVSLDPGQIFLTASTSEAYSFLFRLLLNPKEHLLIPRPSYPLFEYLSTLNDVVPDPYPLVYKEGTFSESALVRPQGHIGSASENVPQGWRIDFEALRRTLPTQTRAVVLVHPNNPTGSFIKGDERKFFTQFARENKLSQICDEVFLDYAYQEEKPHATTFAGSDATLTFTLSGISKILGLPQMKLAWIVVSGPKDLCQSAIERLEVISDIYLSVNTPSQQALRRWFSFRPLLQKEIQRRLFLNRETLLERCRASRTSEVLHAEGGWYAILRLPEIRSEEEWALEFLEKESVLVYPGYFFDFDEEGHVVLSLLIPSDRFAEGVQRLFSRTEKVLGDV